MSFPSRAVRGVIPPALPEAGSVREGDGEPGRYLTDGIDLYRYLGVISTGMGQMVELEDCRTLDVVLLPIGALHTRRLRSVIPSGTA